jgi:hypothetical protein
MEFEAFPPVEALTLLALGTSPRRSTGGPGDSKACPPSGSCHQNFRSNIFSIINTSTRDAGMSPSPGHLQQRISAIIKTLYRNLLAVNLLELILIGVQDVQVPQSSITVVHSSRDYQSTRSKRSRRQPTSGTRLMTGGCNCRQMMVANIQRESVSRKLTGSCMPHV